MVTTKITSNILNNISSIVSKTGFSHNGRKALVVFNGSFLEEDLRLEKILSLKEKGLDISIGFSFMAEKLLDTGKIIDKLKPIRVYREEDIVDFPSIVREYDFIIGPNITMNTLSKVSLGMIDSFIPNVIWTFLYQGKKVYLDYHYVRNFLGDSTKSGEIQNIINNHIKSLGKMGAIEITEENYLEKIEITSNKLNKSTNTQKNLSQATNKNSNLITEKDMVMIAIKSKNLVIEQGTIITPLAKDKARELGIKIERK